MKKTEKHALTVRIALLVMLDILFMQVASFASLWIRHEFDFQAVEETFIHTVWRYMPLNILVTLAVFSMFHLYTSLWKYASITELSCIVAAVAISSLLHVLGMAVMGLKMFKSYLLLYFLLFLFMVVGLRFSYRFFRFVRNKCNRGMAEKRESQRLLSDIVLYRTRVEHFTTEHITLMVPITGRTIHQPEINLWVVRSLRRRFRCTVDTTRWRSPIMEPIRTILRCL